MFFNIIILNYSNILILQVTYQEKIGPIDVKIKKNKDNKGNERISVKTSRYNRNCVNFFRDLDGTYDHKYKIWYFQIKQKEQLRHFFVNDKINFTLV